MTKRLDLVAIITRGLPLVSFHLFLISFLVDSSALVSLNLVSDNIQTCLLNLIYAPMNEAQQNWGLSFVFYSGMTSRKCLGSFISL